MWASLVPGLVLRARTRPGMETAFEAALRTRKNHFGHVLRLLA
jgi:hypothetical protein